MNEECRRRMLSEDFADLFVRYDGNLSVLDKYSEDCINIVNDIHAVIHIEKERIERTSIQEFGYQSKPSVFGLIESSSLEASGVLRIQNIPSFALRGAGVLIGFIDTGIDYLNPIFQNADNTTRILSIWDQTIQNEEPFEGTLLENYPYGTVYNEEQINEALKDTNPLEIVPSMDENGHGTSLAGIAAGSKDEENDFVGVAPDSRIVVVKLKPAKKFLKEFFLIPEDAVAFSETDIMYGVRYLTELAVQLQRPIVICIGFGTSQGGHDSRGALSSYVSFLAGKTGIAIVIAAGNEGNRGHHFYGEVDRVTGYKSLELKVSEEDTGFSMELWGMAPNTFSIDILSPSGEYIPRIPARLGERRDINFLFEKTIILIDYQLVEAQTGDQLILIRFINQSSGIWRFRVYGRGDLTLDFHIWLPMEGFISDNTFFLEPDPYTTITSPGNSIVPITMTAYNHVDQSLYINASRGYTRTDIIKPSLAAPGVNIFAPVLNSKYGRVTGSSAAAAHTAGVAAMMLEWGIIKGNQPSMNTLEIKNFLIRGGKRNIRVIYPNREWGYGILDIYNVFENLRAETE